MDIPLMYEKTTRQLPFDLKQYRILNPEYLDPRRQVIQKVLEERNRNRGKSKFKPPKKRKPCFVDQNLRHIKFVPGPGTYGLERSMTAPLLTKLKPKVDMKLKKNSYLDQLVRMEERFKPPGVGKYNVTQSTASLSNTKKLLKKSFTERYNTLDNVKTLSAEVPGPGNYNVRQIRKIKKEMYDQDYYKQKNKEKDEIMRAKTARPDPCSYQPIPAAFDTFHSFQRDSAQKNRMSRWQHGTIDIRPSSTGFLVSPGPAQHRLINKWVGESKHAKGNQNVKLLDRLWKGPTPSIYH